MKAIIYTGFLIALFTLPAKTTFAQEIVVDDFEQDEINGLPSQWRLLANKKLVPIQSTDMRPDEYFRVIEENGRRYVQAYTNGEVVQIVQANGQGFNWNIKSHPILSWDWRATELPAGGNEKHNQTNDTGAAIYITFSVNFFGIPRSIKYTYSSTLPVGTVTSYSGLKVIVVANGEESFGEWLHHERNVYQDYKNVWGGSPPDEPISIMLWSDSDTIPSTARVDFDNIKFISERTN